MNSTIECPVDFVSVNDNKVRIIALQVFVLSVAFLFTQIWVIPALLSVDFFVRSFGVAKWSLLGKVADALIKVFSVKEKLVDQAPKRFAARVGLLFSTVILILAVTTFSSAAAYLAGVLVIFSFLESFFGFCAGCHVYSLGKKIFVRSQGLI